MAENTTGYMIYNLAFLLLYPKFDCTYSDGSPIPEANYADYCQPEYFCDASHDISYTIDWDATTSLKNWMTRFDLICASPLMISSFSMLYFFGLAIGSIFLPVLGDVIGRRKSLAGVQII